MKKLLLSICAILALGLVSCNNSGGESSSSDNYYYEDNNSGGSNVSFKGSNSTTAYNKYMESMTIYVYKNGYGNIEVKTNPSNTTSYSARRSYTYTDYDWEFGAGGSRNIYYFNLP